MYTYDFDIKIDKSKLSFHHLQKKHGGCRRMGTTRSTFMYWCGGIAQG